MHIDRFTAAVAAALIAAGWPWPVAAAATSNRVWVSGHGVDASGCGAPTTPCRSLQYAHDHAVSAGGEIDILDPAGYGAVTITKAVSIVNDGVGTAGVQATSGNAITINAGVNDAVYLRGLNIGGVNFTGAYGVVATSGAKLTIVDCVVEHFSSGGVAVEPAADIRFLISDTLITSVHGAGLIIQSSGGAVTGTVDRVTASDTGGGVTMGSDTAGGSVAVILSHATFSENDGNGVTLSAGVGAHVVATLDDVEANLNYDGLLLNGQATAHVSRSVFNQNADTGVFNNTTSSGVIYSMGDNVARANGANSTFGLITTQSPF
jgi:hypothetical protein